MHPEHQSTAQQVEATKAANAAGGAAPPIAGARSRLRQPQNDVAVAFARPRAAA